MAAVYSSHQREGGCGRERQKRNHLHVRYSSFHFLTKTASGLSTRALFWYRDFGEETAVFLNLARRETNLSAQSVKTKSRARQNSGCGCILVLHSLGCAVFSAHSAEKSFALLCCVGRFGGCIGRSGIPFLLHF